MTARTRINRQVRIVFCIVMAGLAIFALGMLILKPRPKQLPVVPLIGFAIAWLMMMCTYVIGIGAQSAGAA